MRKEQVVSTSQIDGDFEGMDFDRVFILFDGQEWEQVDVKYKYCYLYIPRVEVLLVSGRYYLRVEGFDEDIEVQRIA